MISQKKAVYCNEIKRLQNLKITYRMSCQESEAHLGPRGGEQQTEFHLQLDLGPRGSPYDGLLCLQKPGVGLDVFIDHQIKGKMRMA